MTQALIALAVSFVLTLVIGRFLIPELRKLKAGQEIREDGPTWHKSKAGTPTMGGIMFILGGGVTVFVLGWDAMLRPYAHASNGGILVDERGATGVPGLFACGEATGGMHGADRIGGLSSANGLVFGHAAGLAAAEWAAGRTCEDDEEGRPPRITPEREGEALLALRRAMGERCLLGRTDEGLRETLRLLDELDERNALAGSSRVANATLSARALATAMLARTESRGAHFRADFPEEDPAQARPLVVRLGADGRPVAGPLA